MYHSKCKKSTKLDYICEIEKLSRHIDELESLKNRTWTQEHTLKIDKISCQILKDISCKSEFGS